MLPLNYLANYRLYLLARRTIEVAVALLGCAAMLGLAPWVWVANRLVCPGITGWAQAKYGYGASTEDALTKLQYDLYYIRHQGFSLDLLVVLRSVQVVLGMRGQ